MSCNDMCSNTCNLLISVAVSEEAQCRLFGLVSFLAQLMITAPHLSLSNLLEFQCESSFQRGA